MSSGQGERVASERVIARVRPHPRRLFWVNALLIVGMGALIFGAGALGAMVSLEGWMTLAVIGGGAVLLLLVWATAWLRWASTRAVITTRRVIVRSGILARSRREVLHSRGYDVTVRQGILQSMFRCGDVVIESGETPVVLADVPRPALVQAALHDLVEAAQRTSVQERYDAQ